ncbi:MAG: hypothetical protein AB7L84_12555 [Acidimicrobiia bacterium]
MIFGDDLVVPGSAAAAGWLAPACRGRWGTVGALVPNDFAAYVRIDVPDAEAADWWDLYRSLFAIVARAGEAHTSTPDEAWFAVWEGYGWATATSMYAWSGPSTPATRRRIRVERARLRDQDRRRRDAIASGLSVVPRFELPNRTYHLVAGTVAGVGSLREPGSPERWQRPDLWWPADRRWFVATDVDLWSVHVGGTSELAVDLAAMVPTGVEHVTLDTELAAED